MTDTKIQPEYLGKADLEELGIEVPSDFWEAWRIDDDTIRVLVPDPDGGHYLDNPSQDNSGDDAWEWIEWDSGSERDSWIEDNFGCAECGAIDPPADEPCPSGYDEDDKHRCESSFRPGLDFWIERYEHGLVRYAPIGESSQIDRQWDVAPGVAIFRFKEGHGCGDKNDPNGVLNFVRAVCDEYTAWCNGDVWGIIEYSRRPPIDAPHCEVLIPEEYLADAWEETESCWGYLRHEWAEQAAKEGY